MKPSEFVAINYPYAKKVEDSKGIHWAAIIAQYALETGWGRSIKGNNFAGIKATKDTPKEKKQLLRTKEELGSPNLKYLFTKVYSVNLLPNGNYLYDVDDWFMKYESPEKAFADYADFFYRNSRYKKALEVKRDPFKFVEEIHKAGYATASNYSTILKQIINTVLKYEPK
ncbi:glucosaminidase domain-containing protein [uncultured Dysgonomonas sp.]|uniref:Mannosyl-glycoprotein endo-beta-N-acetylglucosaminidase n=1 Tax=uncultured Dysgonomonas sp. TaxID=206096 RepID=A0A212IXD2_9BACT|nr:glucosaminidase domain-containing protein [uncultured Dysgonomonas sp.]SBV91868.1 Mannosyl-glycoprotein endo-beta-N-acetylglucosaminidase [uncultured Dysgonomonas sp.]